VYKRILVPTDGSDTAQAGLREACKLAKDQGAQVRVIHAIEPILGVASEVYGSAYDQITEGLRQAGVALLEHATSVARGEGVTIETQLVDCAGRAAGETVIEAARAWPADLIVCGTHGRRGLRRIVVGSDAEYIVRHTPVPILLIREDGR